MNKELEVFVRELFSNSGIPIRFVTLPCQDWNWLDQGLRRDILGITDLTDCLNEHVSTYRENTLYHLTDMFQCSYSSLKLPDSEEYLFIGPVIFEKITATVFSDILKRLKSPSRIQEPLRHYYYNVKYTPYQGIYETFVKTLANQLYGRDNYEIVYRETSPLKEWSEPYRNILQIPERPYINVQYLEDRYQMETSLLIAVINGNEILAMEYLNKLGALWVPSRLESRMRDVRNYLISLNTLLRKATEQSGVHPIHIDGYSSRIVQQIEELTGPEQVHGFARSLLQGYCRMVRNYSMKGHSLLVCQVITYVNSDLTADLSLKTMARQLNINSSYLSSLFAKEMGMPMTEYVNRRRIQYAKKLLLLTNLPVKSIALQCGISDMHYFSRLFKRMTGITPRAFREQNAAEGYKELWESA